MKRAEKANAADCAMDVTGVRPVAGGAFEDILDGYFPLRETVRQMMHRNGFCTAWLTLLHAPVMEIDGLAADEPVPLHLRKNLAGMIERLVIEASVYGEEVRLHALGEWWWVDANRTSHELTDLIRLGEPAFVRGVGVLAEPVGNEGATIAIAAAATADPRAHIAQAAAVLGWTTVRAWGLDPSVTAIDRFSKHRSSATLLGEWIDAGRTQSMPHGAARGEAEELGYLLLNLDEDQADAHARELAAIV